MNLQCEFARRRHDQRQRRAGGADPLVRAQKGRGERQPIGDRLARPGLGRHEEIPLRRRCVENGGLNRRQLREITPHQRPAQRGVHRHAVERPAFIAGDDGAAWPILAMSLLCVRVTFHDRAFEQASRRHR